jgi:TBC1 domain family member 10
VVRGPRASVSVAEGSLGAAIDAALEEGVGGEGEGDGGGGGAGGGGGEGGSGGGGEGGSEGGGSGRERRMSEMVRPRAALAGVPVESRVEMQRRILLDNMRLGKWREMLRDWERWVNNTRLREQLKRRCRKGIPDAVRGQAWQRLVLAQERKAALASLYEELLRRPRRGRDATLDSIERDICRTFPHHPLFAERGGIGQTGLYKVLRAYATHDPRTGYCQGMGFIVALLLSYMPEENAFYTLTVLMEMPPHQMRDLFAPGLPQVPLLEFQLEGLMRALLPRLAAHFRRSRVAISMFAAHWFLTVFTYNFPFRFVTRIWDAFLAEGWKVVFRVALAILQRYEPVLLARDFEGIMDFFRTLPERLDREVEPDDLMERAFRLTLKRAHLQELAVQYGAAAEKLKAEEERQNEERRRKREQMRAKKAERAAEGAQGGEGGGAAREREERGAEVAAGGAERGAEVAAGGAERAGEAAAEGASSDQADHAEHAENASKVPPGRAEDDERGEEKVEETAALSVAAHSEP